MTTYEHYTLNEQKEPVKTDKEVTREDIGFKNSIELIKDKINNDLYIITAFSCVARNDTTPKFVTMIFTNGQPPKGVHSDTYIEATIKHQQSVETIKGALNWVNYIDEAVNNAKA